MNKYAIIFIAVFLTFLTISAVSADENITTNTTVENIEPPVQEKISDYSYHVEIPEGEGTSFDNGIEAYNLPEDATGNITMTIDGTETYNKYVSPLGNRLSIDSSKLSFGNHTASVKYTGDAKYSGFVKNSTFSYVPVIFDIPDEVEIGNYYKDSINIFIAKGVTGNIKLLIDGKTYYTHKIDDEILEENYDTGEFYIRILLSDLSFKKHSYSITYSKGNQKSITKSGSFNVSYLFDIKKDYYETDSDIEEYNLTYGDIINLTAILPDNANSNLKYVLNNNSYTAKLSDGYCEIQLSNFTLGENIIKFIYKDKNLPEKTVTKKINVNAYLDAPKTVLYNETQNIILNVANENSGKLTVKINNNEYTSEIINGRANISINNLNTGKYNIEITSPYKNYNYTLTVIPNLNLPSKIHADEIYNLTFNANSNLNGILKLTGMLNQTANVINGSAAVQISGFEVGHYHLNAAYIENSTKLYEWNFNTKVLKESSDWDMEIYFPDEINSNSYYYESNIVTNIGNDITGDFTLFIDGKYIGSATHMDIFEFPFGIFIDELTEGNHTLTLAYSGDDYFKPINKTKTFEVKKVTITLNYNNNHVIITTPNTDKGTITVNVDGVKYKTQKITPDEDNDYNSYTISLNKYRTQNVEVIYSGKFGKISKTFNITPTYTFEIYSEGSYEYLEENSVELLAPTDLKNNIQLSIDGIQYANISPKNIDEDGYLYISIPNDLTPGKHIISITYPGDSKYPQKSANTSFEIYAEVKAPSLIHYNEVEFVNLTLPKDAKGNLSLFIRDSEGNWKLFNTTQIENGFAQLLLPSSKIGKYSYKTEFIGNYHVNDFEDNMEIIMDVDYPHKMTWGKDKYLTVKTNNITNGYLVIQTFSDEDYYSIRFNGSEAKIPLKNFDIGDYSEGFLRVVLFENGKYVAHEDLDFYVTPIKAKLVGGKNINMYYAESKTYSLKIWGDYGKVVGKGETVTIKIGKYTFKVKTDKNGIVKLKIPNKITAGKYTIKATYHGVTVKNTLNVKKVVTLKTVKVKKSAKKLTLTATLKNKKAIKNAKVTFKFNGKKYTAKTNKKGVAKVTVKKSVLNKLKKGKKVTYQVTYLKQTVKKTAKVKK